MSLFRIIYDRIFKPPICYKKFYVVSKYSVKCDCYIKCKYPPPKKAAFIKYWKKID